MTTAWISHVKAYQKKHNCTYKEALSRSKATYKKKTKQAGGNFAGDLTRLSVAAIRHGMKEVPMGNQVMREINPPLDEGLAQVKRWESGARKLDRLTQAQKDAAWVRSKRRSKTR